MSKKVTFGEYPDPPVGQPQPELPKWLFWDVVFEKMDWQRCHLYVIERVLDRGNDENLAELVRYYGREMILHILKEKPIYLMDHSIQRACTFFKVKPEELRCYIQKQSKPRRWL